MLPKFTLLCFSLCSVFSAAITTGWLHLIMACGELFWVDIKQSGSWLVLWCICWICAADFSSRYVIVMSPFFLTSVSSSRQHTCSCAALCEISNILLPGLLTYIQTAPQLWVYCVHFQTTRLELSFTSTEVLSLDPWKEIMILFLASAVLITVSPPPNSNLNRGPFVQ